MPIDPGKDVLGVLLAGGLARRMGGGDKPLRQIAGRPILDHVIARTRPQVAALLLNANGDAARFAGYDIPVAADVVEGFAGPLAGVLTGMRWAAAHTKHPWIVTVATDTPFLPADLVVRLAAAVDAAGADLACASSGGRAHPVFGLWPRRLADDLADWMATGERKVDLWTARHHLVEVPFSDRPVDPFFNANRPDDLTEAERLYAALEASP